MVAIVRCRTTSLAAAGAVLLASLAGGCMPEFTKSVAGPPRNVIERALDACAERTVERETSCIRTAVAASGLTVRALVDLVPGCRPKATCSYDYTTSDTVGYFAAYATKTVIRWRVTFDLTRSPAGVAQVPVTVTPL